MIYVYGPDEFITECKSRFSDIKTFGNPTDQDIVIVGFSGTEGLELATVLEGPSVFLVCPPSLEAWQEITGSNIKWAGNLDQFITKAGTLLAKANIQDIQSKSDLNKPKTDHEEHSALVQEVDQPNVGKVFRSIKRIKRIPKPKENISGEKTSPKVVFGPMGGNENKTTSYHSEDIKSSSRLKKKGYLIPVYSLKGGTGKTTTTLNFAALMALLGKKVCVVDADINTGSATDYLLCGKVPSVNLLSWMDIQRSGVPDFETVKSLLVPVMGFYFLPGLPNVNQRKLVTKELSKFIYESLTTYFDYIFIDFGPGLLDCTEVGLSMCDITIMVGKPDTLTESAAKRANIQVVGEDNILSLDKVRFIVNLDEPRAEKKPMEVARESGFELVGVAPKDNPAIKAATNNRPRTLPVLMSKDTPLKKAYFILAEKIIPGYEAMVEQKEEKRTGRVAKFLNLSSVKKVRDFFAKKNLFSTQ